MRSAAEPRLLEFYLLFGNLESLDNPTKAALRLCTKQIKAAIDATIIACKVKPDDLNHFLSCNWHLNELIIYNRPHKRPLTESLKSSLAALPGKFPLLEKLKCIDLAGLPENIGGFTHLKALRTKGLNALRTLPPSFSQLTALETLELLDIAELTREYLAPLKQLQQLKYLHLRCAFGSSRKPVRDPLFPEWFCNNISTSLEHLNLREFFPSSIGNLKHLTDLILEHVSGDAPESIGSLTLLQKLDISSAEGPIALPESVSNLTALRNLSIWIDEEGIAPLQYLSCLTRLDIKIFGNNNDDNDAPMPNYPDCIWSLTSLKDLSLSGGGQRLPDAVGNLKNLESLTLNNGMVEIPESIGNLSRLTNLSLMNCPELRTLPESIGNLAALQYLWIERCDSISSLPESIGNLKNLNYIELWRCKALTQLPFSIGQSKSLEWLIVLACPLTELPESIVGLNALKSLMIYDCPELIISPEIQHALKGNLMRSNLS